MRHIPSTIGPLHFIGIGGIGMSGIAEILFNLGYKVQGSDIAENPNVSRLKKMGIPIHIGHKQENIEDAKVVVVSSAVKKDNPEIVEARKRFIPVVKRAEMLGELMRLKWAIAVAGTHGKTTTTSLVSTLLESANMDPTVINGGIINSYGTNARLGNGDWMVVEADESDGSFLKLPPVVTLVSNIDPEHLDYYQDFDSLKEAFLSFISSVPFYGFTVLCIDHPEVQSLIPYVQDRKVITYGFSPQADFQASNLRFNKEGCHFDITITDRSTNDTKEIFDVWLPMFGKYNVQNALGAFAIGWNIGIKEDILKKGFLNFKGVKRRFTKVGSINGITIIDDYAHHPTEITAVLKAARDINPRQVIAVLQPHRYSRVHDLFEDFCTCFNDADTVIVADIYEAGEEPIEGISKESLVTGLQNHGHKNALTLNSEKDLASILKPIAQPGDVVICLGAGSITKWAYDLPQQLEQEFDLVSAKMAT